MLDANEDTVAEELVSRLTRIHRWATRSVVASSLIIAFFATWWAVRDSDVSHGGFLFAKVVGFTGGVTFASVFLTTLGIAWAVSRGWMRRKAEAVRREAVEQHGLAPDALGWVVGMFSPKGKGMGFDDEASSQGPVRGAVAPRIDTSDRRGKRSKRERQGP